MKVVCIDNIKGVMVLPFTIGKVYETTGGSPAQYRIISDTGISYDLSTGRFVTLEEWREMQLNNILEI